MKVLAQLDLTQFNAVLAQYSKTSRRNTREVVAWAFKRVVYEIRVSHLGTRGRTLSLIDKQVGGKRIRISKWVKQRVAASRAKLKDALAAAQARKERAVSKSAKQKGAFAERKLVRSLKLNTQHERWEKEVKMRRNAAGRAGAWGWQITGSGFNGISSGHPAARVSRTDLPNSISLEVENKRPKIKEFTDKIRYIDKALRTVGEQMVQRMYDKLKTRL